MESSLPPSKAHDKMCKDFDIHVQNRSQLDTTIAEASFTLADSIGLSNSFSSAASSKSAAYLLADARNREEIQLLQAQLSKLEEMAVAKDRKLLQLQRDMAALEEEMAKSIATTTPFQSPAKSAGPTTPSRSSDARSSSNAKAVDPAKIMRVFDDVLEKEDAIRELEHQILHSNAILSQLVQQFQDQNDSADALERKDSVLNAKLDVVSQETQSARQAIARAELQIKELRQRLHLSTTEEGQQRDDHHTDDENDELSMTKRSLAAEVERVQLEIEELKTNNGGSVAAVASPPKKQPSRTPSPQVPPRGGPISPRSEEEQHTAMTRRASSFLFSGKMQRYQAITETLLLMKAFLFNLNTDLDVITAIVDKITSNPDHDVPEWRQDKLSNCFLDVVSLMEKPYADDPQAAGELLAAMKYLVVVWDLFESSLEEDIEVMLERATILEEAHCMFEAAQVCSQVVAEAQKFQRRPSSARKKSPRDF